MVALLAQSAGDPPSPGFASMYSIVEDIVRKLIFINHLVRLPSVHVRVASSLHYSPGANINHKWRGRITLDGLFIVIQTETEVRNRDQND